MGELFLVRNIHNCD